MSLPEVYDLLYADDFIRSKIGNRIFPTVATKGTKTPYIVWQGRGSAPENTMDCGATNENGSYQFAVWGKGTVDLEAIRKKARLILEANGFYYEGKQPDNIDSSTPDNILYGRGWTMNYWSD